MDRSADPQIRRSIKKLRIGGATHDNIQLLETAIMCHPQLIAITFALLLLACKPLDAIGSDPISLRPMRETLLKLTLEQTADIHAAGLASIVKAIDAADKDLSESDKQHLAIIRGAAELRIGNSDVAESLLDQALMVDPDDHRVLWLRGRCKEATRRFDLAIEDHQKSLELKPDFPAAMLSLAGIYVEKGDFVEAIHWMEKIDQVGKHGDERWDHFVRAVMALKQRRFPEAIEHADQSLRGGDRFLGVPLENILATKAIALLAMGDATAAKQTLWQVLAIKPGNQQALQMMWTIHNQSGNHLAAYMIAKQMDTVNANNDKFLLMQMRSLIQLRQVDAAEKVARRILEIDAENVQAKSFVQKLEEVKSRNKAAENQPPQAQQEDAQPADR